MGSKNICTFNTKDVSAPVPAPRAMLSSARRSFGNVVEDLNTYLMPKDGMNTFARKVMVVVDSTPEAKCALIWALTHALLKHDLLILLHVVALPPNSSLKGDESPFPNMTTGQAKCHMKQCDSVAVNSLKSLCIQRRPEVEVEIMVVGGQNKGCTILHQAQKRSVSLLVLGLPKPPSLLTRLPMMCSESKSYKAQVKDVCDVVDYCIQNSECMTVGVRKKGRKVGGYVISTKRQKNFWLLA